MPIPLLTDGVVNYDDPRWQHIEPDRARQIFMQGITMEHFPADRHGRYEVTFITYGPFDLNPTPQDVADCIRNLGLRLPNRAEAETFFDLLRERGDGSLHMAIFAKVSTPAGVLVPAISQHIGGRFFFLRKPSDRFVKYARFLAIDG